MKIQVGTKWRSHVVIRLERMAKGEWPNTIERDVPASGGDIFAIALTQGWVEFDHENKSSIHDCRPEHRHHAQDGRLTTPRSSDHTSAVVHSARIRVTKA
jgi:hypothetical protein